MHTLVVTKRWTLIIQETYIITYIITMINAEFHLTKNWCLTWSGPRRLSLHATCCTYLKYARFRRALPFKRFKGRGNIMQVGRRSRQSRVWDSSYDKACTCHTLIHRFGRHYSWRGVLVRKIFEARHLLHPKCGSDCNDVGCLCWQQRKNKPSTGIKHTTPQNLPAPQINIAVASANKAYAPTVWRGRPSSPDP